ncbi:hypothetical protein C343_06236 [Cryptococcus neoformans C23]|uniref:Uncharacterized protein n=1 Tax=Cryptococcus neoformans (strain H99 / ATCC 208821 / CBS 10515 / FGSC 9487) TaxID=235443 RepID=J9W2B0_CRYN9|nr:hypothetical protein CNAG_06020 [Cryptococcus neoformans var. grubii H99]AUB28379.1 hypothetical protein CKF44_06020 [Cryptococcus neoformans var. grubii]OWZ29968.1 hypothetical protein C353_06255 [Cryptococcus neoformans var. grubii AD1-83a]OWZ39457.1 hypothetical protein C343_06236 [Cryptococcus neoformans var. grubii C23]OXG12559.1 hypothetical protein C367_06207 [Cryptococcus neoformans var. grubii Ze90-1]OXG47798.1 hypothetical protein C354_06242 [Cryptococcus neoformans var. grubii MW|eukprot:XP_012052972.1 hypothetical protein CNAG_06020 [Cryptococcus neoformans var. grubii H99]
MSSRQSRSSEQTHTNEEHHLHTHSALKKSKGNDLDTQQVNDPNYKPRGWVARSEFWTWNCFTVNMGTGAVAILVGGVQFPFNGQREIGTVFFMIDLVVFLINIIGVASRAIFHWANFKDSFFDHSDGTYIPCILLAVATLFVGIMDYGVPYCGFWLTRAMYVVYWVYVGCSLAIALILECTLRGHQRKLDTITPADCLLFFPLMLSGTIGSALATKLPLHEAGHIIIISYWLQGMGMMLSILKCSVWMARNMLRVNPAPSSLPGYLIAVGPPGFTAFAFLNLGNLAVDAFPASNILTSSNGGQIFQVVSVWYSLILLGLGLYILLSTLTIWIFGQALDRQVEWSMGWWSFTFPLTGFFMAMAQLGAQLPSKTFKVIQVVGCLAVAVAWLINFTMTLYSIFISRTLGMPKLPKKDDEDEGYEKDDRAAQPGPTQWGIRQSDGKAAWASTSIDA